MAKSFLQSPYFDDYDENKKFYKILFRPSIPVQARELTQIQSMVQKQVERFGKHFFKEGDKVVDGQLFVDTKVKYLKLSTTDDVTMYVGKNVYGNTSKAEALIVAASNYEDENNPSTLFVKFISSGEDTNIQEFSKNEVLSIKDENITYDIQIQNTDDAIGYASTAQVNRGVYFIYGNFVLVDEQTIVLEKYSNMPTYKIGFEMVESIVTPEKDSSLYDNAIGSYNEAAPGAHRYYIDCVLAKRSIKTDSSDDFIELAKVVNGEIVKISKTNEENTITEDVLARRTFDESGDYVVRQFKTDIREHRSNDRGVYSSSNSYIKGDIVKSGNTLYKCLVSGTTQPPSATSSEWESTNSPVINNGVYNAIGRVTGVEIKQSRVYESVPEVEITQGDSKADAVACLDENGKLVKIELISSDNTFTSDPITVTVRGETGVADVITNIGKQENFALTLNSGKAYVKGYEIEKVGSTVLAIPKARTTESKKNQLVSYTNGNYIYVTDLTNIPDFSATRTYNLYNVFYEGSQIENLPIGTCKIRGVSRYEETTGIYKIYLSDVTMLKDSEEVEYKFDRDVKCIGIGSSAEGSFYGNIIKNSNLVKLSGTITATGTTVSGTNTNFTDSSEIKNGDWIYAISGSSSLFAKVVSHTSQNEMTIDRELTIASPVNFYRINTTRIDPQNFTSVYKLTNNLISDVTDFDFKVIYYHLAKVTGDPKNTVVVDTTNNKTTVTFAQPFTYGDFSEYKKDFILSKCGSNPSIISSSDILELTIHNKSIEFVISGQINEDFRCVSTITIHNTNTSSNTIDDICQKKFLTSATKDFTYSSSYPEALKVLTLDTYDAKEVVSVMMDDGSGNYTVDVTDRYDLDNGQRDAYYIAPKLTLKSSYTAPQANLKVTYKYFNQTQDSGNVGFVVNSYQTESRLKIYDEVPSYNGVSLRNCIDFRQRYGDSTSYPMMLKDGEEIEISYSYYLPRKDRICLDSKGNFVDIKGIPSLDPQFPEIPSMSMNLYNLTINPYVFDVASDVALAVVDNKRYTMRDIGKLETRIKNLEDYTTLSLLEQQTTSMTIKDSEGLDRFKQGFVVDNFKSKDVVSSTDNKVNCSIDVNEGVLRPSYITRSIGMSEYLKKDASTNYTRDEKNYMAYGKVFTLPLDENEPHSVLVSQPIATRTENINPFAVVRFLGSMSVNPSTDDWYETEYIDDAVTPVEGNYQSIYDSLNGVIVWDDWEQSWTGIINTTSSKTSTSTSRSSLTERRFGDIYTTITTATTKTTTNTYAQDIGYSRAGLLSTVQLQTDYEEVGDYLVSTTNIPYMRSRNLLIKAKGLKPNTKFYPFFDGVNISTWCTPATVIEYTPQNSLTFDTSSLAKKTEDSVYSNARIIENSLKSLWSEPTDKGCLDIGDVIKGNTSNTTAVVVGKAVDTSDVINGYKYYLYVVNVKGSKFIEPNTASSIEGETFTGNISGAIGKIVSVKGHTYSSSEETYSTDQNKQHGEDIITNRNGEAQFIFWIPDSKRVSVSDLISAGGSGYIKFKCGDRTLSVNDNENNDNTVSNSRGEVTYSATGILNTRQKSINAVRNAKVVTESINENKTVTNTWSTTSSNTSYSYRTTVTESSGGGVDADPLAQTFRINCAGGCFISKVDVYFSSKDDYIPVTMEIRTVNNGYPSGEVLAFGECTLNPEDVKLSSNTVTYLDDDGLSVSCPAFDTPTTFTFDSPVYVENGQQYAVVLKTDSTNYRVWIAQIGETVPGQDYLVSNQPSLGVLFKSQNASTWSAEQNQDLMFTVYRANFKKGVKANIAFKSNDLPKAYLSSNPFQTTQGSNVVTVWHQNHGFSENNKVVFTTDDPNTIDTGHVLTGKISIVKNDTKVTGTGTKFDVEVKVNDALYQINGTTKTFIGFVKTVSNSTELILTEASSKDYTSITCYSEVSINGIKPTDIFDRELTVKNVNINNYQVTITNGTTPINAIKSGYAGGNYIKASENYKFDLLRPNITSQTFSDASVTYTLEDDTTPLVVNDNNEFTSPVVIKSKENHRSDSSDSLIIHCTFSTDNQSLSPVVDSDRISSVLVSNLIDNNEEVQEPISNYITKEINLSDTANYLRIAFEGLVTSDYITSDSKLLSEDKIKVYYKTYMRSSISSDLTNWKLLSSDSAINSSSDYQDISYSTGEIESFDTFKVKIVMLSDNTSNVPKIKNLRMVACL